MRAGAGRRATATAIGLALLAGCGGGETPDPCAAIGRAPRCSSDGRSVVQCLRSVDQTVELCRDGEACDSGRCLPLLCPPGFGFCDSRGTVADQCSAGGTAEHRTDCAARGQTCVADAMGARCVTLACAPGQLSCSADGAQVLKCDPDGLAASLYQTCGDPDQRGNRCLGGACVDRCGLAEADRSSRGCRFVGALLATGGRFRVRITNPQPDLAAKISLRDLAGHSVSGAVAPLAVAEIEAPWATAIDGTGDAPSGVLVESSLPVLAAQIADAGGPLADGATLIPEPSLGDRYLIAIADDRPGDGGEQRLVLVGAATASQITLTLASPTAAGGGVPSIAPGKPVQRVLGRGEVLQLAATGGGLAGSVVSSSAPLAAFVAIARSGGAVRHLEAPLLPWSALGERYGAPDGQLVIVARDDATHVTAGGATRTLAAGESLPLAGPLLVAADRPIAVALARGGMATLVPSEQWLDGAAVGPRADGEGALVTARDPDYTFAGMAVSAPRIDGAFSLRDFPVAPGSLVAVTGTPAAIYLHDGAALLLTGAARLDPINP